MYGKNEIADDATAEVYVSAHKNERRNSINGQNRLKALTHKTSKNDTKQKQKNEQKQTY